MTDGPHGHDHSGLSRRQLIQLGAAGVVVAGADTGLAVASRRGSTTPVGPTSPLVAAAERKRPLTGKAVSVDLRAQAGTIDLQHSSHDGNIAERPGSAAKGLDGGQGRTDVDLRVEPPKSGNP